jgi:hypothetical protein
MNSVICVLVAFLVVTSGQQRQTRNVNWSPVLQGPYGNQIFFPYRYELSIRLCIFLLIAITGRFIANHHLDALLWYRCRSLSGAKPWTMGTKKKEVSDNLAHGLGDNRKILGSLFRKYLRLSL